MRRRRFLQRTFGASAGLLAPGMVGTGCGPGGPSAVLGAKTYSEQIILGELLARLLRASGLEVTERFQMQTFVLHTAIVNGDLDCYIEYTGTSYSAIMHETFVAGQTAEEIYGRVKELYRERFDLRLGPPIGFANDYVLAVPRDFAREKGVRTISDLARISDYLFVAGYPFFERADGLRGMMEHYGFAAMPESIEVEVDMVFQVMEAGQADVAVGNSTDGRLAKLNLLVLEDDLGWFPPYESALLYRPDAHPAVAELADRLGGAISTETMRALNRRVDVDGEQPADVAAEFFATLTG